MYILDSGILSVNKDSRVLQRTSEAFAFRQESFTTESVVICIIGGTIGVILGVGVGYFISSSMGYPTLASLFSILISAGFSLAIGVFFGYYPANKAAKLKPLDALRYE